MSVSAVFETQVKCQEEEDGLKREERLDRLLTAFTHFNSLIHEPSLIREHFLNLLDRVIRFEEALVFTRKRTSGERIPVLSLGYIYRFLKESPNFYQCSRLEQSDSWKKLSHLIEEGWVDDEVLTESESKELSSREQRFISSNRYWPENFLA